MKRAYILSILIALGSIVYAQPNNTKTMSDVQRKEYINAFKLNLLSPFYGTVNLSWQHVVSNEGSFQITATYMDFDSYGSNNNTDGIDGNYSSYTSNSSTRTETDVNHQVTRGITLVPEFRYLLNGRNLSGSYIAPFLRYMYYEYSRDLTTRSSTTFYSGQFNTPSYTSSITQNSDLYSYHALGLGMIFGRQYIFKNKVAIDLFAGPVYSFLVSSNIEVKSKSDIIIGSGIPNTYLRGYGVRAGITIGIVH
jgi:hypothetical protein